jgi:hypothetical protein
LAQVGGDATGFSPPGVVSPQSCANEMTYLLPHAVCRCMQLTLMLLGGVLAVAALTLFLAGISMIAACIIGGVAFAAVIAWVVLL